ncbi:hypothetical protein [Bacillus sp. T33-2]|uniref:hypothetical protein n=1 Tax=Bacillus sp. T33-2 TaxID=2054168 RepID=UPI000C788E18|nr:hypothetical protein [Bacillus sp. T33-2]PLR96520.1 hypothetical protein CVD19_11030 [Bacillus sp. T33-2]
MAEITRTHDFEPFQDLRGKAGSFKYQLEEMGALNVDMLNLIQNELKGSHGKIIEEIRNTLENNYKDKKRIINDQISMMDILAGRYSTHINDMNTQDITIYYEKIKTATT